MLAAVLFWSRKLPELFKLAPEPMLKSPALQVVVPAKFTLRLVTVRPPAPLIASAPLKVVEPEPFIVPPLQLLAPPAVTLPVPPSEPEERLREDAASDPLTVSAPPAIPSAVPALMLNRPATDNAPPVRLRFSSESMFSRLKEPEVMVTVCAPATLTRTRWPEVGAAPLLQLAPTDQSPLVPIQQSSTVQVLVDRPNERPLAL